ncbi:hypothetical protein J6590_057558 [Homalodisca vitripennis]|nr:hypothetical protein J6590_057558 [Homalodisca vitripennis]
MRMPRRECAKLELKTQSGHYPNENTIYNSPLRTVLNTSYKSPLRTVLDTPYNSHTLPTALPCGKSSNALYNSTLQTVPNTPYNSPLRTVLNTSYNSSLRTVLDTPYNSPLRTVLDTPYNSPLRTVLDTPYNSPLRTTVPNTPYNILSSGQSSYTHSLQLSLADSPQTLPTTLPCGKSPNDPKISENEKSNDKMPIFILGVDRNSSTE